MGSGWPPSQPESSICTSIVSYSYQSHILLFMEARQSHKAQMLPRVLENSLPLSPFFPQRWFRWVWSRLDEVRVWGEIRRYAKKSAWALVD